MSEEPKFNNGGFLSAPAKHEVTLEPGECGCLLNYCCVEYYRNGSTHGRGCKASKVEHHHHLELDPHKGWHCTICGEWLPLDYRGEPA